MKTKACIEKRATGAMLLKPIVIFLALTLAGCENLTSINLQPIPEFVFGECKSNGVRLGRPRTTQGDALCHALIGVQQRQLEISDKLAKLSDTKFDLTTISLGVLSVGAIAASSHVSVLETLGIATAGTTGLKAYAGTSGRRAALASGIKALQCFDTNSRHLLWDDSSYYELRSARGLLYHSNAQTASLSNRIGINSELKKKAELSMAAASKALEVAEEANAAYSAIGGIVRAGREEIVAKIQAASYASRKDVDLVIQSILNAERVKAEKINGINQKIESIDEKTSEAATTTTTAGQEAMQSATQELARTANLMDSIASTPNDSGNRTVIDVDEKISNAVQAELKQQHSHEAKLQSAIAISTYASQMIVKIAPTYIKARAGVEACGYI